MTLSATATKVQYAGDGSSFSFPVQFVFWESNDLRLVLSVDATGVETVWTRGTQYTVSGGNGSTGTVTVVTSPTDYTPAAGETLTIKSNLANLQNTSLPVGGALPSATLEQQLDKMVRMLQQRGEELDRALTLPESSAFTGLTIPDPESGKILRYKADLSGFEAITFGEFAEAGGSVVPVPIGVSDGGTGATTVAAALTALTAPGLTLDNAMSGANAFSGINTFSAQVRWAKGADVASANALTLGTDGNYFDITGTTAITSIETLGIGTPVKLHFDGALTLTHHATDLVLPGGANITTAAGDEAEFVEYAAGDWRCVNYQRAASVKQVAQVVSTLDGAVATGTTVIPFDDTIPQNTEGDEYMTLAITPTNANSVLIIEVVAHLAASVNQNMTAALFQDSTAGALAAANVFKVSGAISLLSFRHVMTAGTTSAITMKVRAGGDSAGTTTFNGIAGGRQQGGVLASSIVITEVLP